MKGASLGRFLALPSNITLGWNGFPGTNTLAYNEHEKIKAVNFFIILGPGANPIKTLLIVTTYYFLLVESFIIQNIFANCNATA